MTASAASRSSAAQLLVEPRALERVVVAAEGDRPLPDPLDEREQLRPGLLRDDLAEQRAEQPDLDRERVARTGRPDPERLGATAGGRRRANALTRAHRGSDRSASESRHRPQPSAAATFP